VVRNIRNNALVITINEKWCKSCGICVEFCPRTVLAQGMLGRIEVANIESCNICRLCELRCPEMAIIVREGDSQNAKGKSCKVNTR
jgi:2-oxoglutarate ferredoxin oxidoreductase subunit delta